MPIQQSANIGIHNPVVTGINRHDTGTLAVTLGDYPVQAVIFFATNEAFEAFVAPIRAFLAEEEIARLKAMQLAEFKG